MTTRWSRVVRAGEQDGADSQEALASLCRDYWRPLFHFARRKGHSPAEAQDLTQGFICSLLESNGIARADRNKGRFRTFLLGGFCHHLAKEHRSRQAQKRGGVAAIFSLDGDPEASFAAQAAHHLTPELQFERSWALALLERIMGQLEAEYRRADRGAVFEALRPHLSGAGGRPGYAALGAEIGLSEGAVATTLHRMRRRYGELLRAEIASTVEDPAEVDDELRHLLRVVADPR
ncbi:MAG: sigma-70 family RNA polymerase sigma factor [Verrucomicrobia bacterium]|nr:sigma-70 family RNA polymerase sigma factor [Verrucomicrobiota bacterium]